MGEVFNKEALRVEEAELATCPRCKGAGGISADVDRPCTVCGGDGEVWMSVEGSGWLRRIDAELDDSDLW